MAKLTILINYQHYNDNDDLKIELRIFRFIKYKIHVPVIKIDDNSPSVVVKSHTHVGEPGNDQADDQVTQIGKHDIMHRLHNIKELLERVFGLHVIVRKFFQKVVIKKFEWETLMGIGDAAYTAMAAGALWTLKGSIIGLISHYLQLKEMPKLSITPHFQAAVIQTRFTCMIQFRIGHAILAGLKLIKFWKGGRSRFKSSLLNEKTKSL
ncbi:DUF2953 domain-containing protein [Neobacillus endophyticus]|uniref:DUF2953 domain-containing protein n=1 Tax=Neobacillus endophyticus TaxID=2738405 RepID=UPI001FE86964|nr:DUF2953 domain-containing protein [Neobacillus endophyticus]